MQEAQGCGDSHEVSGYPVGKNYGGYSSGAHRPFTKTIMIFRALKDASCPVKHGRNIRLPLKYLLRGVLSKRHEEHKQAVE